MRILVTGSRDWTNRDAVNLALHKVLRDFPLEPITLVHGGCPTGADYLAHSFAHFSSRWIDEEVHPADWKKHGRAAGPIRNQHMVDLGADLCVAFPLGESRGTRHCMKAAAKAGIPVWNAAEVDA